MTPSVAQSPDAIIGAEYEDFKDEVVRTAAGKLAASKIQFSGLDMDAFYNQAWYGLYTKLQAGDSIENRKGLLVQMTYRRAIDEYRTMHPDRQADPVVLETLGTDDPIEETIEQRQQFQQILEGMRSGLNQRELQAATLCYVYGLSRPEAAEQVGVRPKRMEKIMDEVSRKMRPMLAAIKEGEWCEDRAVLINQFALGALDADSFEYREAVAHLEHCPGCRRHVLGTRGLTAVTVPSALLLLALTGGAAAAAGGTAVAAGLGSGGSASGAAGGGGAAAGAGVGAGAGIAQVAAVVAAVAAVAAGGFVVANQVSKGDQPVTPASTSSGAAGADSSGSDASESAAKKAAKANAAKKRAARRRAARKRAAAKEKSSSSTVSSVQTQPQVQTVPPAQTAPQDTTPSDQSSEDASEEFDLR